MFLDTSNLEEIKASLKTGVFKGVTTNPTILLKENRNRSEQIKDILELGVLKLFVQVVGATADELFEDYRKIKALNTKKNIAYKVSMDLSGLEVVKRIREDDQNAEILGTAIYSSDQAILAAIAGCSFVAPYVNRMENNSIDPYDAIEKMRLFFDERDLSCKIVAASFKNTSQIVNALTSGAHTCTIPYDLFLQMINKDVAASAIKVFNEQGQKLEKMK